MRLLERLFRKKLGRLGALFDVFCAAPWCTLRGAPFGALFACCAAPCINFDMATLLSGDLTVKRKKNDRRTVKRTFSNVNSD